jgi:di/tricarboxylate transporter
MVSAGTMSAIMNNVAVAALMLPVVMDIARHTGSPPSRLLMPLAYGSLLGGLTTQIGTPPNILVSEALHDAGLRSFTFFDYTPMGLTIMFCGIAFMIFIGRLFLPRRDVAEESTGNKIVDWESQYDLDEQLFNIRIPHNSMLIKKTLAESRLGSALRVELISKSPIQVKSKLQKLSLREIPHLSAKRLIRSAFAADSKPLCWPSAAATASNAPISRTYRWNEVMSF